MTETYSSVEEEAPDFIDRSVWTPRGRVKFRQRKDMAMKGFVIILIALAVASSGVSATVANDPGARDGLQVADLSLTNGVLRVSVDVINDQGLAALDIPLRFGQQGDRITLESVEWASRVEGWDLRHAAIDNENKTIILGLISDLQGKRRDQPLSASTEGNTRIATLVFRVAQGYMPTFEDFVTLRPGHSLSYLYIAYDDGTPYVEEFRPEFGVNLSYKQAAMPTTYQLSQNLPNPFNPNTSFVLSLPDESDYTVSIYNVVGQVVKTFRGHAKAGQISVTWDGTNDQGMEVASGVYFYRADARDFSQTRKMMLLR
jgi:hypothetical protein